MACYCTWEDSDYKPCELHAMDCISCDYYCEEGEESNDS